MCQMCLTVWLNKNELDCEKLKKDSNWTHCASIFQKLKICTVKDAKVPW